MNMNTNEMNLPPSLIILKNSIIEGRVPTSEKLEVGEIALGLFGGNESIWAKNSEGNVVNLRSPRHDLFWNDLFIKFDTKERFETLLNDGKIKNTSIVFIKDTKEIWAGGEYYASSYSEEELESIVSSKIITIPSEVYNLTSTSTSDEISTAFGGVDSFKMIVNKSIADGTLSGMILPGGGSVPVSVIPKIFSDDKYELKLEWVYRNKYVTETIILEASIFTVTREEFGFGSFTPETEERINALLDINKPLVSPVIDGKWTFYNLEGEEIIFDEVDPKNPQIESGYRAKFTGTYSWNSMSGYKNPESVVMGSNWIDLPEEGVESSVYTSEILSENTSIMISITAPRTGLMVQGEDVVPAEGYDTKTDSRTITFNGKLYFGIIEKESEDLEPSDIVSLTSSLITNKSRKFDNVTLGETEYFVYAYPKSFGELNQIIQDGSIPVIGAFNLTELVITSSSGASVTLNVYTTNNPGVFTNASVEFK